MTTDIENKEVTNAMYAGTLLMSELSSLFKNDYSGYNCNFESSNSNGNLYRFEFKSEKASRTISISYSPPFIESKLHCFFVHIDSTNDSVSLVNLINEHKLFDNINYLNLKNYKGNTKQKIEQFVKFLDKVFTENFPKIISGEEWEHIGFDWQGYK